MQSFIQRECSILYMGAQASQAQPHGLEKKRLSIKAQAKGKC